MKKNLSKALLLSLAAFASTAATAGTLNVGLRTQEHSNWCWATTSQMVLSFAGKNYTQCALVNHALGINYACGNSTFQWNSQANSTNSAQAIASLVQAGGVSANTAGRLSESQSRARIDAKKPFIIAWYWTSGGGHVVVAKGYSGSTWYLNDPWPGNGSTVRSYAATAQSSDRNWRESIVTY